MANSHRRCAWKECRESQPISTMIVSGTQAWCSSAHQYSHALANLSKLRTSTARAVRAKDKAQRKESVKRRKEFKANDLSRQKALTQAACNKLCLLLDKGLPCISSGVPDDGKPRKRNASHLKSRGSNSFLRYSLLNLHAATAHDNNFKSGNIEGYRKGLTDRYGPELVEYLDNAPRVKAWTCEELSALRAEFSAEIRRLESGLPPSKNWRELPVSPLGQ